MLNQNFLIDKLYNSDEICVGTWSMIYNPMLLEIISSKPIDFLVFDSEHGPWNFDQVIDASMICEKNNVSPILRVSDITRGTISKALDCGIHGVQIPNIENEDEINLIENFSKFPPLGKRGFSPFTRGCGYSSINSKEFVTKTNKNLLNIIHIENREGLDKIDEILDQDSVDIIFVGLFDLSMMLNYPGQIDHKEVLNNFSFIAKKVIDAKKILGSIATDVSQLDFLSKNEVRYLTFSADCQIISETFSEIFTAIKE